MLKNEKQFWNWWTEELRTWFTSKFSALTSVVAKDATVAKDSTVAKNATVAKEATLNSASSAISNKIGTATDTKTAATLFGKIADVKYDVEHLDTSDLAKRTDVKNGNNTTIGMLENQTYGLNALKNAISQGGGITPEQYNALAKENTLTTSTASIIAAMPSTSELATEANATANRTALANAIAALQGSNTSATLTAIYTIVGAITSGLTDADKTWLQQQFAAIDLSSITSRLDNNTYGLQALKNAIASITIDTSSLAQRTDVKDGNDTVISVVKLIKEKSDEFVEATEQDIYDMFSGYVTNDTLLIYNNVTNNTIQAQGEVTNNTLIF